MHRRKRQNGVFFYHFIKPTASFVLIDNDLLLDEDLNACFIENLEFEEIVQKTKQKIQKKPKLCF